MTTAAKVAQVALELAVLAGNNLPRLMASLEALKVLFDGDAEPTEADIDALVDKIKAQGDTIAQL